MKMSNYNRASDSTPVAPCGKTPARRSLKDISRLQANHTDSSSPSPSTYFASQLSKSAGRTVPSSNFREASNDSPFAPATFHKLASKKRMLSTDSSEQDSLPKTKRTKSSRTTSGDFNGSADISDHDDVVIEGKDPAKLGSHPADIKKLMTAANNDFVAWVLSTSPLEDSELETDAAIMDAYERTKMKLNRPGFTVTVAHRSNVSQ